MINKTEIDSLISEKKYNKALDYLYDYYTGLLKKILDKNEIEVRENDTLVDYIDLLKENIEKYKESLNVIVDNFFNEELDVEYKVESLIDEVNFWEDVYREKK